MRFLVLTIVPALAAGQDLFLASAGPSQSDLRRARSRMPPRSPLAARSSAEVSRKVNQHLGGSTRLRACTDFTHEELHDLATVLWELRHESLQALYEDAGDKRALRHRSLEELLGAWAGASLEPKCAELLALWAHHLTESGRAAQQSLVLPTLPEFDARLHSPEEFTCASGHRNNEEGWDTEARSYLEGWPAEVTYNATGHGPYPFWLGPAKADIEDGASLQVWWSRRQQAEKFYHEVCGIGRAGYSQDNAPCFHLMLAGDSYLYTATEDFCCISGAPRGQQGQVLTASQFDWFSEMTFEGEVDYEGEFYKGTVRNYTMDCSGSDDPLGNYTGHGCGPGPFHVWYYTDLNGKPIEQGEGCQIAPHTSHCNGATYLFHQYNPDTWIETAIDPSVFEIPEVCKTTTNMCLYP